MDYERITKAGMTLGSVARVVGVATQAQTVEWVLAQPQPPCDVLELRLDHLIREPVAEWESLAMRVEVSGIPTLATLRLEQEGGLWCSPDEDRWPLLKAAFAVCSCVDVEIRSVLFRVAVEEAIARATVLVASSHDFQATPATSDLVNIVDQAGPDGPLIVKIAARVNDPCDTDRLLNFLHAYTGPHPLCLIGMGDAGIQTRVEFPRLGSCLTYGHLDESTAPGQLSCRELREQLGKGT